jgi:hypothetical protein
VLANVQAAAAVGAAAGVAGVATVAVVLSNGGTHAPTASPPRPSVTGPLSEPSTSTPSPEHKKKKRPAAVRTTAPVAVPTTVAATPTEEPTQQPEESKTPKPDKPSTAPVTTVAPPTVSDVRVRLTFSLRAGVLTPQRDGLLGFLNAGVTGIPTGQKATLTVHVVGGRLVARGPGCRTAGSTATCEIGPGTATPQFNVMGIPVSASATVTAGAFSDPVASNNSDSVLLGLLRVGSLRK